MLIFIGFILPRIPPVCTNNIGILILYIITMYDACIEPQGTYIALCKGIACTITIGRVCTSNILSTIFNFESRKVISWVRERIVI